MTSFFFTVWAVIQHVFTVVWDAVRTVIYVGLSDPATWEYLVVLAVGGFLGYLAGKALYRTFHH